jgi:hypothetical protein
VKLQALLCEQPKELRVQIEQRLHAAGIGNIAANITENSLNALREQLSSEQWRCWYNSVQRHYSLTSQELVAACSGQHQTLINLGFWLYHSGSKLYYAPEEFINAAFNPSKLIIR